MSSGPARPTRLLRDPNFRRLWLTGGLAGTVRWLQILSISVFTFDLTGSPLWVAALMVARMLPMILFGTIFGAYAERFNRRYLLLTGLAVVCCVDTTLGSLAYLGTLELWHVGIGAFLSGTYFATDFPVRRTLLGESAGEGRMGAAMALDSATNNATRMLGPALGGATYQLVGLSGAYTIGALAYATCIVLCLGIAHRPPKRAALVTGLLTQIREGLRYVRREERIFGTLLVTVLINLFAFPFASMVPVIGRDDLGLTPTLVGILASAEGAGAFLGALTIAGFARPRHYGRLYLGGSFCFLIAIVGFSASPDFGVAAPVLLAGGLGVAGFSVMQSTILLTRAAPEYRSRTMGVLAVCIGSGPLGILHVGILAEHLGAVSAVQIIAIEGMVAMGATFRYWRRLWTSM